jgi:hypothetical protein
LPQSAASFAAAKSFTRANDDLPHKIGENMQRIALFVASVTFLGTVSASSHAQDARWGSADESTVKFMTASESKWANSACGAQSDLKTVIADDFQGTSTNGNRYPKADAVAVEAKPQARDCRLDDIKVRFFGNSIAVAYGAESRMQKGQDGTEAKRCQVWTDTWLQRNGHWQIVSAQDTVIPCKP